MVFSQEFPLLSLLIWLPIVGGALCLLLSRYLQATYLKTLAVGIALVELCLCIPLIRGFDNGTWAMQWVERRAWLPDYQIYYHLGVDGFALPLLVLSCLMTLLVIMSAGKSNQPRMPEYLFLFLIL